MRTSANFRLTEQTLKDLKTLADLNSRSNTNMIEVLISEAKKDLQERGKWPLKG